MRHKPNNHRKKQRTKDSYVALFNTKEKNYKKYLEKQKELSIKIHCLDCFRSLRMNPDEFNENIACTACLNRGKISFYKLAE